MPTGVDRFAALAARALVRYGIDHADVRLIRHNENVAYEVTDPRGGSRYLLRIHQPISSNLLGIQHTFEGLMSEVEILQAFGAGTGLLLQRPVANDAGGYVTTVNDSGAGASPLCTLLTWVPGEILDQSNPDAPHLLYRLGETVAAMHGFSHRWIPTRPLIRPVYDAAKYLHMVDRIGLGVEAGLLSGEQHAVLQETVSLIADLFGRTPATRDTWGIIHADLRPDNVVVAGADLVPIDFCFAGFGFFLFDVGGILPALKAHLRQPFLDGYQAAAGPLSADETRLVNACFLLSLFGGIGFSITNPNAHEWIKRRMPVWVGDYCGPYLQGEPIIGVQG